jgi:hypothetical protein
MYIRYESLLRCVGVSPESRLSGPTVAPSASSSKGTGRRGRGRGGEEKHPRAIGPWILLASLCRSAAGEAPAAQPSQADGKGKEGKGAAHLTAVGTCACPSHLSTAPLAQILILPSHPREYLSPSAPLLIANGC